MTDPNGAPDREQPGGVTDPYGAPDREQPGGVTDPYAAPDWEPWDVESARRWAWSPPLQTGPDFTARWCPACDRLEPADQPLHGTADEGLRCPCEAFRHLALQERGPVYWCPRCRYLLDSPDPDHPFEKPCPDPDDGRPVRATQL